MQRPFVTFDEIVKVCFIGAVGLVAIFLVCVLGVAAWGADIVSDGPIYELKWSGGQPTWVKIAGPREVITVGTTPDDPDEPDEPEEPTTITQRIAKWAAAVGDPQASELISRIYLAAAANLPTSTEADPWAAAITNTRGLREFLASRSPKANEWRVMFGQVDAEIAAAPKTAATLEAVGLGFQTGASLKASDNAFDWGQLITCLIQSFFPGAEQSPSDVVPIPIPTKSILLQPAAMTRHAARSSVLSKNTRASGLTRLPPKYRAMWAQHGKTYADKWLREVAR